MATERQSFTQPSTYDFLKPNAFRFFIDGLPNVNYTCQGIALPGVQLGEASVETPFIRIPVPGDKLVMSPFTIDFIISDEMQNYIEIVEWMKALGFPDNHGQFRNLPNISKNAKTLNERSLEYSDATLIIYSSANNPKLSIRFMDVFPVSINNVQFDLRTTSVDYLTASVTFAYRTYDIVV